MPLTAAARDEQFVEFALALVHVGLRSGDEGSRGPRRAPMIMKNYPMTRARVWDMPATSPLPRDCRRS